MAIHEQGFWDTRQAVGNPRLSIGCIAHIQIGNAIVRDESLSRLRSILKIDADHDSALWSGLLPGVLEQRCFFFTCIAPACPELKYQGSTFERGQMECRGR